MTTPKSIHAFFGGTYESVDVNIHRRAGDLAKNGVPEYLGTLYAYRTPAKKGYMVECVRYRAVEEKSRRDGQRIQVGCYGVEVARAPFI